VTGFAHFGTFFLSVLKGKDSGGHPFDIVGQAPETITEEEMAKIGGAFVGAVVKHELTVAAVDDFINVYGVLRNLSGRYIWFKPLLSAIAVVAKDMSEPGTRRTTSAASLLGRHSVSGRMSMMSGGVGGRVSMMSGVVIPNIKSSLFHARRRTSEIGRRTSLSDILELGESSLISGQALPAGNDPSPSIQVVTAAAALETSRRH
jgi:hypothetical protein